MGEFFLSKNHAITQHFLEKKWRREYLLKSERTGKKFATKLLCRNSHLTVAERMKFSIQIRLLNPEIT